MALQSDDDALARPTEFDGFRFAKMHDDEAKTKAEEQTRRWSASAMSTSNLVYVRTFTLPQHLPIYIL